SPVTATHVSQAVADAVFLGERLAPVQAAVAVSQKALSLMRQNLWLAGGYNAPAAAVALCRPVAPPNPGGAKAGFSLPCFGQRLAGTPAEGGDLMEVLVYLVPLAIALGALGLGAFLWSLKSGQYDDLDGAAWRAIADDEEPAEVSSAVLKGAQEQRS